MDLQNFLKVHCCGCFLVQISKDAILSLVYTLRSKLSAFLKVIDVVPTLYSHSLSPRDFPFIPVFSIHWGHPPGLSPYCFKTASSSMREGETQKDLGTKTWDNITIEYSLYQFWLRGSKIAINCSMQERLKKQRSVRTWAIIPHVRSMPFPWALWYGKCPRSFVDSFWTMSSLLLKANLVTKEYIQCGNLLILREIAR